MPDQQRDVRLHLAVIDHIHRIHAGRVELQLLDGQDEIAGTEMEIAGQRDFDGKLDGRHDGTTVGIHEVELQLVTAFVGAGKRDAQGHRALRMDGGQFPGVDRVERAEQAELFVVVGCGITQHRHLNVHARTRLNHSGTRMQPKSSFLPTAF